MSHDAILSQTQTDIGKWSQSSKASFNEVYSDLKNLAQADSGNSNQWKSDLLTVNKTAHGASLLPNLSITGVDGTNILVADQTGPSRAIEQTDLHLSPVPGGTTRPQQTIEQFPDRVANLQWQNSASRDQSDCSSVVTANMIYLATGKQPTVDQVLAFDKSLNDGHVNPDGSADPTGRDEILKNWGLNPTDYHNASVDTLAQLVEQGKVTDVAVNASILRGGNNDGNGLDHVINVLGVKSNSDGSVAGFYVVDTGVSPKVEYVSSDAMKAATFNNTDIQTVDVNGGPGTTDSPTVTPQVPVTDGPNVTQSDSSGAPQQGAPFSQPFSQGDSSGGSSNNGAGATPLTSFDSTGVQNTGGTSDSGAAPTDPNLAAYSKVLQDTGMSSISAPTLSSWLGDLAGMQFPLTPEEIALLEKEGLPANLVNALAQDPQLLQTLQSSAFKSFVNSPNFASLGKIGDPNSYFVSQIGGSPSNPNGDRNGNEDCGPTSIVMALRHFGKLSSDPQQAAQEIDAVRNAMGIASHTSGIGLSDIVTAANKYGLKASPVKSVQDIENALSAGKQVVAVGNPIHYEQAGVYGGSSYDQKEPLTGSNYGNNAQYNGWHYIDIVGMTADGKFVVDDPLSRTGSFAITQSELQQYLGDSAVSGAGGNGVAIGP